MNINDINILIFLFFNILLITIINPINLLNVLILSEILWIILYACAVIYGYYYDDLNLVSMTFFFLIFSAAELILGFILVLVQNTFLNNSNLVNNSDKLSNLTSRLYKNIFTTKFK